VAQNFTKKLVHNYKMTNFKILETLDLHMVYNPTKLEYLAL